MDNGQATTGGIMVPELATQIARWLGCCIFLLVAVHTAVYACWETQSCGVLTQPINMFGYLFDLDREDNIPTWFAVTQLFLVAIALALAALFHRMHDGHAVPWWGLSAIFTYMSLDEATDLHGLWGTAIGNYVIPGTKSGNYAWLIPGAAIVLALFSVYFRWVLALPGRTRALFIIAGCTFVSGGLLLEGLGALLADESFTNASYLISSTFEETFELLGVLIMLYAVVDYLQRKKLSIALWDGDARAPGAANRPHSPPPSSS